MENSTSTRRWRRLRFGVVVSLGAILGLAGTARALDLFVKVAGIDGDVTQTARLGWIVARTYQLASSRPAGAAVATFDELVIAKEVDRSTPELLRAFFRGTTIASLQIEAQEPTQPVIVRFELTGVRVSSFRQSGTAASTGLPADTIGLRFDTIKIDRPVTPSNPTAVTRTIDVPTGKVVAP